MEKKPLFRKVNTLARGVRHNFGGEYRHERNTKAESSLDISRKSMHGRHCRGLDYTPLFKFLLSKVGSEWNQVFSEAVSRLDEREPVFWLVALHESERKDVVRVGESSYYSGLYVDSSGLLKVVNPELSAAEMTPSCPCCTHTFNGVRFGKSYEPPERE